MTMIDNISIIPKPAFHNLNRAAVESYLDRIPKGARLYALLASHGEGIDETQPITATNNEMVYFAYSFIIREIFNKESIDKILQVCSYVDFKYALVIILALHEKIGSEKIQESISIYLSQSTSETITERMDVFLKRLTNFLTFFTLEYINLNKRDSLNNEA